MTKHHGLTINGRFLSQNQTGVQRYAFHTLKAMESLVTEKDTVRIIAPRQKPQVQAPQFPVLKTGPLSGHAWEQSVLPAQLHGSRLLNLCNTAPVVIRNQIVCIHDANVFTMPESYSRGFRAYYRLLQPWIAKRSLRVATVSQSSARQIARHLQIPLGDIAILPNGHEHALTWSPERAELARTFYDRRIAATGRQFILLLGSRAKHKNLQLLLALADDLDRLGIDLVVAGGGSDIFPAAQMQQHANVSLLGRVSDDDLAFLLDRALCLVFPSLTEGFGLPLVEAMARGCPIISSHLASMPDVCGDAALLASPFDAKPWLDHIKALLGAQDLRQDLIEKGRRQMKNFSWRTTAEGYLALCETPGKRLSQATPSALANYATAPALSVSVAIATRGRPAVVSETVRHLLAHQTLKPQRVVLSTVDPADAGDLCQLDEVEIITGPGGLAAQRNTALAALSSETDIVVFFDDDFVADRNWLAAAVRAFQDENRLAGFTGLVVADGIKGPGLSFAEAISILEQSSSKDALWMPSYSPYGCNMAFRHAAIGSLRFDERLVLYGWLEDRDFGAALARQGGLLVQCGQAFGVHMGSKSGRVSGLRLGYSQIINPLYMLGKGTISLQEAGGQIFRNVASNLVLSLKPEPYIDRIGRLKGNLTGFADVLRGTLQPEKAAKLFMDKDKGHRPAVEQQK
ncbi:glycosyltransferase [Allorhizobium sp. BGMRC 0089]|uniref:glycosyltransferase n=1 Tax=Allorhizobium sonneratiae TaxID=2934936 RepID=UPI002033B1BC|nr:glycosyltransferase [Allorhizobium sonneratiae]MCM2293290.1 glycosyltransferase [Allorhizobium sonneratiae]